MSSALCSFSSSTQVRRSSRPATPCSMPYTLPAPRRLQLSYTPARLALMTDVGPPDWPTFAFFAIGFLLVFGGVLVPRTQKNTVHRVLSYPVYHVQRPFGYCRICAKTGGRPSGLRSIQRNARRCAGQRDAGGGSILRNAGGRLGRPVWLRLAKIAARVAACPKKISPGGYAAARR